MCISRGLKPVNDDLFYSSFIVRGKMEYIKILTELDQTDLNLAGGKGANLGALIKANLPVPPGFCITTRAYIAFTNSNKIDAQISKIISGVDLQDPTALDEISQKIRTRFENGKMDPILVKEISNSYRDLGTPAVAVRSSATAEDLPDLSFAGQQDTYLNIQGENSLLDAVVGCWASLWTARAIGYRARQGINQIDISLAVIVQRMVQSEVSGVLFTANPLTGKRQETVIDATFGLGEALVSGQVEPDRYVVETNTGQILSKFIGAKAIAIHGQAGGGTAKIQQESAERQALPDAQITALAELGRQAETHFGSPQDMEWAWADNTMYAVQSRPITSLYPLPLRVSQDDFLVLFSLGAMQGMLDPFTPIGRDVFRFMMVQFNKIFGRQVSMETQRALFEAGERLFFNFTPLLRNSKGRVFVDVYSSAIDPGSRATVETLLHDPRLELQKSPLKLKTTLGFIKIVSPIARNVMANLVSPVRARGRLVRSVDDLVEQIDRVHSSVNSLSERVRITRQIILDLPRIFFTRLIPAVACGQVPFQILLRLCAKLTDGHRLVLELTRGLPYNVTTEMDLKLWKTARIIKSDPISVKYFTSKDVSKIASEYKSGSLPPMAQAAVDQFMQSYGMRGVGEIDMGRPRWQENPTSLFQALTSYLSIEEGDHSPDVVFERGAVEAEKARKKLVELMKHTHGGAFKAKIVDFLAMRVRQLTGLRESPKLAAIRAMTAQRRGLLISGEELASAQVIENPTDIFFLHLDELEAMAAGDQRDWKALLTERHMMYERELRRRQVPRVLLSDGTAFYDGMTAAEDGEDTLSGSPVSPGVVEGIVHVVLDPSGTKLEHGEILVCPATDPAWTPLFLTAGGLLMEVGGMMTHGSVVAREYGIPAVVGVHQVTTRLRTGQRVRIDGSSGKITILD
jgi:pyruvate,water dikinase